MEMKGFVLIKTTFQNKKKIIGTNFNGEQNYSLFIEEAKKAFNIANEVVVEVLSDNFVVQSDLFSCFVAQYITATDFILEIKLSDTRSISTLPTSTYAVDLEEVISNLSDSPQNTLDIAEAPLKENTLLLSQVVPSAGERGCQVEVPQSPLKEITAPFYQTYSGRRVPVFTQGNNYFVPADFLEELPSTQDIKEICEVQNFLKIPALENKHRTSIAKALITLILKNNPDRKLIREDFLQLSQSIVDIFPSEVKETYYVPFQQGHLARGKLYDAYNNRRSLLSAAGVIRRRVRTISKENHTAKRPNNPDTENTEDVNNSDFEILKLENCAEWDLVLSKWRKTHSFRQNELKDEHFKTADYFAKYKVLSNEKNYELFDIDFKVLYPTSKSIYEWKLYYHKVLGRAEKLKDRKVKEIVTYIKNTEDEDSKLALSLMLIPYLLPNCRQKNKAEIQESFIFYCKNILDADNEIRARIKRLKIESQPKIFLVGDSKKTICIAYVEICGKRLKFENPVKAVEVCFHCFMGMNIKYPKYSSHVWIFMQKLIFEINTQWDTEIPAITTLINDLRLDTQK